MIEFTVSGNKQSIFINPALVTAIQESELPNEAIVHAGDWVYKLEGKAVSIANRLGYFLYPDDFTIRLMKSEYEKIGS